MKKCRHLLQLFVKDLPKTFKYKCLDCDKIIYTRKLISKGKWYHKQGEIDE